MDPTVLKQFNNEKRYHHEEDGDPRTHSKGRPNVTPGVVRPIVLPFGNFGRIPFLPCQVLGAGSTSFGAGNLLQDANFTKRGFDASIGDKGEQSGKDNEIRHANQYRLPCGQAQAAYYRVACHFKKHPQSRGKEGRQVEKRKSQYDFLLRTGQPRRLGRHEQGIGAFHALCGQSPDDKRDSQQYGSCEKCQKDYYRRQFHAASVIELIIRSQRHTATINPSLRGTTEANSSSVTYQNIVKICQELFILHPSSFTLSHKEAQP